MTGDTALGKVLSLNSIQSSSILPISMGKFILKTGGPAGSTGNFMSFGMVVLNPVSLEKFWFGRNSSSGFLRPAGGRGNLICNFEVGRDKGKMIESLISPPVSFDRPSSLPFPPTDSQLAARPMQISEVVAVGVFCSYFSIIVGLFLLIARSLSSQNWGGRVYVFIALSVASFVHTWFLEFQGLRTVRQGSYFHWAYR
ncbi:hypothetical protein B0H16DRAFT_1829405 [Mycena metata]|uniref:Uncharacterized protein n=1 Tax=Mycena metata TaxID=1033252 RepID=A0AAD7GRS3_9AGAR|nr:hypothetical protein B0H16DRAFT_1829405 [Mycena metata]